MAQGIVGLLGLAVTLAFAIPVALLGLQFLGRGETLFGVGFLGLAVLMVLIEEYVVSPGDLPGLVAGSVVGRVAKDPEEREPEE